MAAEYPPTIATIPANKQDDTNRVTGADEGTTTNVGDHAAHHNKLAEELVAVQTELGTDPAGIFTNVRERFEAGDWKRSVVAATTAILPAATYATGPPATLTANANGALPAQDGVTLVTNDRLFVKDQVGSTEQNGIYEVTQVGSGGTPWILTRTKDADTALKVSDAMYVAVQQGITQADTTWELISDNPISLGSTGLRFTRITPPYSRTSYRDPWAPTAASSKYENMVRDEAAANLSPLSTGRASMFGGIVLRAGVPINGITFITGTTGATAPSHKWFALVRLADRVYLRSTGNDTNNAWAANTSKRLALSSPYTPDVDTPVYVAIMVVATTVPSLAGKTNTVNVAINTLVPILSGTGESALTTPRADGTVGAVVTPDRNMPYFALD